MEICRGVGGGRAAISIRAAAISDHRCTFCSHSPSIRHCRGTAHAWWVHRDVCPDAPALPCSVSVDQALAGRRIKQGTGMALGRYWLYHWTRLLDKSAYSHRRSHSGHLDCGVLDNGTGSIDQARRDKQRAETTLISQETIAGLCSSTHVHHRDRPGATLGASQPLGELQVCLCAWKVPVIEP